MHIFLFPSPRERSEWRGGVRGGGQPRARSKCSPPTRLASLATLPANGREGRAAAFSHPLFSKHDPCDVKLGSQPNSRDAKRGGVARPFVSSHASRRKMLMRRRQILTTAAAIAFGGLASAGALAQDTVKI